MTAATLACAFSIELGTLRLDVAIGTRVQRIAIAGPSGAGKSTTLRILAGVEPRARGRVALGDEVWLDSERGVSVPPWQRRVGFVPQDSLLFPHLDVAANLAYGGADPKSTASIVERLEIGTLLGRSPRNLSGGERQRVAIARALLLRPRLLLLDEPFTALDAERRADAVQAVREAVEADGVALVLASHDGTVTDALVEERFLLRDGALVACGPPSAGLT
jgi:molybdate transport system ATP-binding protein